jgi:pilus assembly protein Flp/PilA
MAGSSGPAGLRLARRLLADECGATAIEYAMIAAGIGATIATTVWGVGSALKENWYDKIANIF